VRCGIFKLRRGNLRVPSAGTRPRPAAQAGYIEPHRESLDCRKRHDRCGHQQGGQVLRRIGQRLASKIMLNPTAAAIEFP
jgi:hypothetical protein